MRSSGWGTPLSTAILMGGGERRQAREIPGSAHERDTPTGISEPGEQKSCSLEVTKFSQKSHHSRGSGGRVLEERTLVPLCRGRRDSQALTASLASNVILLALILHHHVLRQVNKATPCEGRSVIPLALSRISVLPWRPSDIALSLFSEIWTLEWKLLPVPSPSQFDQTPLHSTWMVQRIFKTLRTRTMTSKTMKGKTSSPSGRCVHGYRTGRTYSSCSLMPCISTNPDRLCPLPSDPLFLLI